MKILVVDDETSVRQNLARLLRLEGFDVVEAADGQAGLALAEQELPDLILSDVVMPVLNGHQFLEALRAHSATASIPFVFITALTDRVDRRQGMNLGADDYLYKPFTRDDVLDAVHARLRRFQGAQTLGAQVDVPAEGVQVKGYRILRRLGGGGMSEVYLAERESDGLVLALKLLDTRTSQNPRMLDRFIQECELLEQVKHPNVARIYGHGFTDTHAFISMEYFSHGDIRQRIAAGISPFEALTVTLQVAQALSQIHALGIVHRDVKPDNLMLRADGGVALIDFGVAKHAHQELEHTHHGELVGSPYYMSPEQAAGRPVHPSSDIYCLGVIFYEMVTGRRPYTADSMEGLLNLHLNAATPRFEPKYAEFQWLLDGMMQKQLDHRYRSAQHVADLIVEAWPQVLRLLRPASS
ncbi:protein kinase [Curvibacter sp. APW13]|uniref:protein kinase domain-containing protein n=1 Tax=Curvibacter sp. APW13 TaxID=3077236 RepID=UPI0028DE222C|nr:protein kinase [Curvibacter sp. APW13]MDT8991069.1 protein kinase [Curvibacter sp. APW13]